MAHKSRRTTPIHRQRKQRGLLRRVIGGLVGGARVARGVGKAARLRTGAAISETEASSLKKRLPSLKRRRGKLPRLTPLKRRRFARKKKK